MESPQNQWWKETRADDGVSMVAGREGPVSTPESETTKRGCWHVLDTPPPLGLHYLKALSPRLSGKP